MVMALNPNIKAASKLRADHAAARATAIGLAIKLAEGGKVDDKSVLQARQAADISASDFAAIIDRLTARKAAEDALHARDWEAEKQASIEGRREAQAEVDDINAEFDRLRAESVAKHDKLRALLATTTRIETEQRAARSEYSRVLAKTGGGDGWQDIT